jgi:predicted GIY-YIG superfamily endonuclease
MARVGGTAGALQAPPLRGASQPVVYLLHAERPHPVYGWQHYIGWTRDLGTRFRHHKQGKGSRVTREWRRAGIAFRVARTWPGASQGAERRLQRIGGRGLCPVCSGAAAGREAQEAAAVSPSLSLLCSSASSPGGAG